MLAYLALVYLANIVYLCVYICMYKYICKRMLSPLYIARSQLDVANFLHGDSVRYEKQSKALQSMIFLHKVCPLAQR